ncbi:unnamed protein product [Microthlaspi erraticum]|uniref:Uncharacterized protein n=1 Tax=Microthlaspi erraticum TaxID=1685480 RepID=A0A6D2JJZ2_9BRAS|nr:unnamed protein product [Microthlaspi erraticum]
MDFIKTTSPRALSELTLQHKWIRIIWMSRNGVMIALVKSGPDSRNRASSHSAPKTARIDCPRNHRPEVDPHSTPLLIQYSPRPSAQTEPGSKASRSTHSNPAPSNVHDRIVRTGKHRPALDPLTSHNPHTAHECNVRPEDQRLASGPNIPLNHP